MLAYTARRIMLAGLTMAPMSLLTFVVIQLPEGGFCRRGWSATRSRRRAMRPDGPSVS